MILEIGNDTIAAGLQRLFDCSWLSRYSEENERLLIGYDLMLPLKISSIRIIETCKNYRMLCQSLWMLDFMLSGSRHASNSQLSDAIFIL